MNPLKLVVLSGAGLSAESGIKTFRDSDGLWEEHHVEDVATYDGWLRNPELVQNFYNDRRVQLAASEPNEAHKIIAELEHYFKVFVITQNVDNLHERAGSSHIIHLHGELTKAESVNNKNLIINIGYKKLKMGDKAPDGAQLRPHIVWFGEAVPMIEPAIDIVSEADIVVVIGTSMQVYPAAGLIGYAQKKAVIYYIDPKAKPIPYRSDIKLIQEKATVGMAQLKQFLIKG